MRDVPASDGGIANTTVRKIWGRRIRIWYAPSMIGRDVAGDDAIKTKRAEVNIGVGVVEAFGCLVGHVYLRSCNGGLNDVVSLYLLA